MPTPRVRTHDGRIADFEERRIADAITRAMVESGSGDAALAEELSAAVRHFLGIDDSAAAGRVLEASDVEDMTEKVLVETGHWRTARAFVIQRDRERRRRDVLRKAENSKSGEPKKALPRVGDRLHSSRLPWRRSRIVAALVAEAGLDDDAASEIAGAVEERVRASGLDEISTSRVRELVDAELIARGDEEGLSRQGSFSLPRTEIERLLFERGGGHTGHSPRELAASIGDQLLRQYALDAVHRDSTRTAHREGRIELHDLDHPLALERLPIVVTSWTGRLDPARADSPVAAFDGIAVALRELAGRARQFEVIQLEEAIARSGTAREAGPETLANAWIGLVESHGLLKRGRNSMEPTVRFTVPFRPRRIAAPSPGDLFGGDATEAVEVAFPLVAALRQVLLSDRGRAAFQRVALRIEIDAETFTNARFREALHSVLLLLPRTARVDFERVVPAGRADDDRDRRLVELSGPFLAGRVTLNLPRIALGSGESATSESLLERAASATRLALEAIRDRSRFLDQLAVTPPDLEAATPAIALGLAEELRGLALERGVPTSPGGRVPLPFAIGVAGLDDAVRIHNGQSLHETTIARDLGVEILTAIAATIRAANRDHGALVVLEETGDRETIGRFRALDRDAHPARIARSRENVPEGAPSHYAPGVRSPRWAPIDPLERDERLDRVRSFVRLAPSLDDARTLREDGPEVLLAFLEECCSRSARRDDPVIHSEGLR